MDDALQSQIDEANRLLGERKYDEIVNLVQPLLIRETEGQAQRVYGMALLGQAKYQEAVHILMTAAQLLPNDVTVAFAYGNAMNLNGQAEGGRASFERALGLDANHPGAKLGYLNTSKTLAERDEAEEPMKAIEWLYGPWQRDMANAELGNRILDIYLKNGWTDGARAFVDLMPPQVKNSEAVLGKMKTLPAAAPPVNPANIQKMAAAPALNVPSMVLESCPFCKQQIMAGVHTCPHCKMVIRAKALPGADYKPEWQEATLNILCWIGMVLFAIQFGLIFMAGAQSTPIGALGLVIAAILFFVNLAIWQRVDFVMHIAKWIFVLMTIRSILCSFQDMTMASGAYGRIKEALMIEIVILMIIGAYSAFMVYLLNHEGE